MRIDRKNYEQYVMDYLEGRLTPDAELLMKQFLLNHPDIAEEVEGYDPSASMPVLSASIPKTPLFKSFSNIQSVTSENFEEFCIAHFEGDLDKQPERLLKKYLTDKPEKKSVFELYRQLKFKPDHHIRFPDKQVLIKRSIVPVKRIVFTVAAAAAAIALLLVFFRPGENGSTTRFSTLTPKADTNKSLITRVSESINMQKGQKNNFSAFRQHNTGAKKFAAIDSGSKRLGEKVIIASLKPIIPVMTNQAIVTTIESGIPDDMASPKEDELSPEKHSEEASTEKHNRLKNTRKKLLWGALHIGIMGINSLTENDLALHTEKTSDGKLSEIAIENSNFEITRKIGRNMQD